MRYATGYAFSSKELFENFPTKKLETSRQKCKELFKTIDRKVMAIRIFLYSVKIILLDIINNNVTFMLPTQRECYLHISRTSGEEFKKARRNGKWLDVDYLRSNFSGYQMEFVYIASERDIHKPVYLSSWMKDMITKNTNEGKQYF